MSGDTLSFIAITVSIVSLLTIISRGWSNRKYTKPEIHIVSIPVEEFDTKSNDGVRIFFYAFVVGAVFMLMLQLGLFTNGI